MAITITYKSTTKGPDEIRDDKVAKTADETDAKGNQPAAFAPKKLRNDLLPKFTVETRKLSTLMPR